MSVATRLLHAFGAWPARPAADRVADQPRGALLPRVTRVVDPDLDDDVELAAAADYALEAPPEPGFADLEAAVALVRSGLATHVVLSGFPSFPGLLWRAYELSEETGVSIVPRATGDDGLVELEVRGDRREGG